SIFTPLQACAKLRKRLLGAPKFKSRQTHPSVSRDFQTEITDGFRGKNDRGQLGETILLKGERKGPSLGGSARDPFKACHILSHEKEIAATCAVLLCYVARRERR